MMRVLHILAATASLGLLVACPAKKTEPSPDPSTSASSSASGASYDPSCGFHTKDWCAAPAGDPCGTHPDVASCLADARCEGLEYRGESVAACITDARCFASNCPTVGCLSRCETFDEKTCTSQPRCKVTDHKCGRYTPCGPAAP